MSASPGPLFMSVAAQMLGAEQVFMRKVGMVTVITQESSQRVLNLAVALERIGTAGTLTAEDIEGISRARFNQPNFRKGKS